MVALALATDDAPDALDETRSENDPVGPTLSELVRGVTPLIGGRYVVTGVLGRGGMAIVYRARRLGGGPDIALKRIAGLDDARTRARFEREAGIVRRLHHPNLVQVLEVGDGHPGLFIAMERLEGKDLSSRLGDGPIPADEVVHVGVEAAAGLAAAHVAGVVHRDVKPSNVFCCLDGRVKILDFGLALFANALLEPRLTATGRILGTPAYMAVEQVQGDRTEDERTDVWGLGATLYHAVSGSVPFPASSLTATLVRITLDPPDPLPPHVPAALAEVILRCLEKDPARRWQDMRALGEALRAAGETLRPKRAPRAAVAPSSGKATRLRFEVAGVDIPMVGRDADLMLLQRLVERARLERRAEAALVLGPAGIGKSRLRHELRLWLESHGECFAILEGRGEPTGAGRSYGLVASVLRARAMLPEGTSEEVARERLATLVAAAGLAGARARATAAALGLLVGLSSRSAVDPQTMGDRIRLALGDLFEGWTRQSPVVLSLDDLHWADDASLGLIEFLRLRLAERPFALVATSRPDALVRRPDLLPGARRVELGELGLAQTEAIAARILGRPAPDVARRAAGVPYFAEELALAVLEGAELSSLPATVEGALQSRLEALPADERELLQRAAVLGSRFWIEGLDALGRQNARALLPALRRRELVIPRHDTRLAGCEEWSFRHALIHEVAYGMLVQEQLRALHARAAAWLGTREGGRPEEIARHHEAAGETATAEPLWLEAARDAHRSGDSAAVVALSDRVLARGSVSSSLDVEEEQTFRLARVEAFLWLGRTTDAASELDALAEVEERALASGAPIRPVARARALVARARLLHRRARYAEALPIAEAALALLTEEDASETCAARLLVAYSLAHTGHAQEGWRSAEAAVAIAAVTGDAREWSEAQEGRGFALAMLQREGESIDAYRNASETARSRGYVREAARSAMNLGWALMAVGDLAGAHRELEGSVAMARQLGLRMVEGFALHNLGLVLGREGRAAEGIDAETRALAIAEEIGHPRLAILASTYRSMIATEASNPARGLADADEALRRILSSGITTLEPQCRTVRAAALARLGRNQEALAECHRALNARASGGMEELEIDLLVLAGDLMAARGLSGEAVATAAEARLVCERRLSHIADPHLRRTFCENVPAHARALARID